MSLNKKDLAPLTFKKVPPEQMVRDYLYSKATNKVIRKFPEWDEPRIESSIVLVDKMKELNDVEHRLVDKRKDAGKLRKELDDQWKELERKEKTLRDNFIRFNKFVKENQEKRERAERKITEEHALVVKREADIQDLQSSYEHMLEIRSRMEKNIRSHKLYEDFLLSVVRMFPTFRSVDDILDRYESLAETRRVLGERQEADLTVLEESRNEMIRLTEDKIMVIMGLYNKMAELQSRYEIAKQKALHWEAMVTKIKCTCISKMDELHKVRQSTWGLYLSMCRRKEIVPDLEKDDIENQLLFVKRTMLELKRITKTASRKATKDSFSRPDTRSTKH